MPPTSHHPAGEPHDGSVSAGSFGAWLARTIDVLAGRAEADVPCDGCVACCSSRQFVHVEPDEIATLERVPAALRFPAPGLPAGHVVIPYDADGRCPMLGERGCTIYDHRPRTCRTYDCRVFVAAGLAPDDDQPLIAARVDRWRFEVSDRDRVVLDAVRATAQTVTRPEAHPDGRVPPHALHLAGLAVSLHRLALDGATVRPPDPEAVQVSIRRRRRVAPSAQRRTT